jgi:hypothetical protein
VHHGVVFMPVRQSISRHILAPGLELDRELVDKELAHPGVLRNGGYPLVQEIHEAKMVGLHHKRSCLEIRLPMAHCFVEADELRLVRC